MKARIVMILMAVALYALPTVAQNMEFRSTSTMQGTGNYVAPVTAVGATSAAASYSPAQAPGGPRRMGESGRNAGDVTTGSTESPIGDALIPLTLMAVAFGGYIAIKRRKTEKA